MSAVSVQDGQVLEMDGGDGVLQHDCTSCH